MYKINYQFSCVFQSIFIVNLFAPKLIITEAVPSLTKFSKEAKLSLPSHKIKKCEISLARLGKLNKAYAILLAPSYGIK